MKTEKLILENFGPFKKRCEIDLKQIVVFIGPQSSGKSIIAKLVSIFRNYESLVKSNIFDLLENYNIKSFLRDDSKIVYQNKYYNIVIEDKDSRLEYEKFYQ